jgi:serine/threonine protein kinase
MKQLVDDQSSLQFGADAPEWAFLFASLGKQTRDLLSRYLKTTKSFSDPFGHHTQVELKNLVAALETWNEESAARLLEHLLQSAGPRQLDLPAITRWVLLHKNDPEGVSACMDLLAPEQMEVIRLLPRTGSQKLVFEAGWGPRRRPVVLKRLTGSPIDIAKVQSHELNSHPLSTRHPNIIETHFISNGSETFLVEEWLTNVLSDNWQPSGMLELASLAYALASAVAHIHQGGYVHGDIKPDNMGKKDDRFVLLDFGLCRLVEDFTPDTSATGSLRTRAPELLKSDHYEVSAYAADIWAIGATLFNFEEGRFPFLGRNEPVPRVSSMEQREAFEGKLAQRAEAEWDQWVRFDKTPASLRGILQKCLSRNPQDRPTAPQLRESIARELSAYISEGAVGQEATLPPIVELQQLSHLLERLDDVSLLAPDDRGRLHSRIKNIRDRLAGSDDKNNTSILSKLEAITIA